MDICLNDLLRSNCSSKLAMLSFWRVRVLFMPSIFPLVSFATLLQYL